MVLGQSRHPFTCICTHKTETGNPSLVSPRKQGELDNVKTDLILSLHRQDFDVSQQMGM